MRNCCGGGAPASPEPTEDLRDPSPALRTPRGSNTARSVLFPGAVCVSSSLGQARPERVDFARGAAMRLLGSSDKQTRFCPLAVALELEDLGSSLGVAPS